VPQDLMAMARTVEDKDSITDTIAVHANLSFEDRQKILETIELKIRMVEVSILLKKEMEILQAEQRIKGRIQNQVEKNQREYYLTEQIKALYKELGREDHMGEILSL
jgi:ATP-dependent Lon protease